MNVSAALDWLFSTQFFGIKLGLDNTRKLLAAAGADRINATVVHVAGTNGKGSTCAMIEPWPGRRVMSRACSLPPIW